MFRPTDPQQEMFGKAGLLPPKKRAAREKSWAGPFREKALPIVLVAGPELRRSGQGPHQRLRPPLPLVGALSMSRSLC